MQKRVRIASAHGRKIKAKDSVHSNATTYRMSQVKVWRGCQLAPFARLAGMPICQHGPQHVNPPLAFIGVGRHAEVRPRRRDHCKLAVAADGGPTRPAIGRLIDAAVAWPAHVAQGVELEDALAHGLVIWPHAEVPVGADVR